MFTIVEKLQYFGEKEVFEKSKKRKSQAKCLSVTAQLYRIHKNKLFGFNIMNYRNKRKFQAVHQQRVAFFNERIENAKTSYLQIKKNTL